MVMGRPAIEIDWSIVDGLCEIQCTRDEIAGVLGIEPDTLVRKMKEEHGIGFVEYFSLKSASGKASLRRKQYTIAMDGNAQLLVHLGKNWLGQSEKTESKQEITGKDGAPLMEARPVTQGDLDHARATIERLNSEY